MPNETRARPRPSLRARLLGAMSLCFAVLLVLILPLLWGYARDAANRSYDLLLAGAALSILERTSVGPDGPVVDLPTSAFEILSFATDDRVVYAVRSEASGLVTGTSGLPEADAAIVDAPRFFDAPCDGEMMRFVRQSRRIATAAGQDRIEVQIGQTRDARRAQAGALFRTGAAGFAAVSLAGVGFVWLAIGVALRPLRAIERDLSARDPADLSPLALAPPREVAGLTGAIDDFMGRLAGARTRAERFIADVAHQSRTSLATLRGEIALAADARDPTVMRDRLGRAEEAVARGIRLNEQLLTHAMVIHRAEARAMDKVALAALVRGALAETMRGTAMRVHDVTFDVDVPGPGGDRVRGDPVALREALRNLIDNAVRHGPPANVIDVAVAAAPPGHVTLSVEDAGPGIAPSDRRAALERFTSLGERTGGTGLGLAIVKAVADAHRAEMTLSASPAGGLRVALRFPAALGLLLSLAVVPATVRAETLAIWSATDAAAIAPVIAAFEATDPGTEVRYREFNTAELHAAILAVPDDPPDVVISSAMDLQVDLVNRGLARRLAITGAADWASWRGELFGFTREPVATIYDRRTITGSEMPRSHADLARFIRENETRLVGRIGTYDIRTSGVGYLFATQDANRGQQFLRVAEAAGRTGIRVYCCTSEMIADVGDGRLGLAINVIGSYALAAADDRPDLGVHFFDDYNLVMARSLFVPRGAANAAAGERFVHFILSPAGQAVVADRSSLLPIKEDATSAALPTLDGTDAPIRLGLPLLTYLDAQKRESFIANWEGATQQDGRR